MFNSIQKLDQTFFLLLNRDMTSPVLDTIMPFITDLHHWLIPIIVIWLGLLFFGGKKGRIAAVTIIILVTMSDQMAASLIKPLVHRIRPCHPDYFIQGGRFLIGMKKSFSFPSNHAANMGALATYFSVRYPKTRWIAVGLALIISYSRIYVGVHFLTDILAGLLLGFGCGLFVLFLEKKLIRLFRKLKNRKPLYPIDDGSICRVTGEPNET
jgi:undecaprenyl-diphosphatase